MSFVSNALGISNGYQATSGAGANGVANSAQQALDTSNTNNVYGEQGNLAQQLLAQSQGAGPNIANLQLQQATNQNNQQAAGAEASQRGMNPALAQRLIAQQQASNNQNAAGQSGVLRAQQQLASQNALANVYGQQQGVSSTNLGTLTGAQTSANNANAQIAQNNSNQNAGIAGGILGAAGSMFGGMAEGGKVGMEKLSFPPSAKVHPLHLAFGGMGSTPMNNIDPQLAAGAPDLFGGVKSPGQSASDPLAGIQSLGSPATGGAAETAGASGLSSMAPLMLAAAHGGKIPVMLSPGELKIPKHKVAAVARGKETASEAGQRVPGKAKVKGDSLENDTFPTYANSGDVIIKRTKAQNDKDAREFLLAIKADKDKKEGPSGYAKILAMRRKSA